MHFDDFEGTLLVRKLHFKAAGSICRAKVGRSIWTERGGDVGCSCRQEVDHFVLVLFHDCLALTTLPANVDIAASWCARSEKDRFRTVT